MCLTILKSFYRLGMRSMKQDLTINEVLTHALTSLSFLYDKSDKSTQPIFGN